MSYINYGDQFAVNYTLGTPVVVSGVTTGYTSQVVNVVPGRNIANAASGITVAFIIPSGSELFTPQVEVINIGHASSVVTVSGISPIVINGSTAAVTVTAKTGVTLQVVSGTNYGEWA